MKIYNVTFNDGGWHSGPRPSFQTVAENSDSAIEKVLEEHPSYRNGYDKWCSEFKIEGYVIEVYNEKQYKRDKEINKILDDRL